MKRGIISRAMAVIARTAGILALAMPKPPRAGWPAPHDAAERKPAGPNKAGSKLARMAREGRVGVSKIR